MSATTFDLLFLTKESKLEEFEDIAEKIILGSKAKIREADIEFLIKNLNYKLEYFLRYPKFRSICDKKFL